MPELPEVEVMRRYFEEAAIGQKVRSLEFHDPLDKIFKSPRAQLREVLEGARFVATHRIGKYLFVQTDRGPWLHLHFGMTGNLELFHGEDLPPYTRLVFVLENEEKLAYCDLRKFGVVELTESPEAYQKAKKIGPDFLGMELGIFVKALENKKIALKSALLEQKHFAGIGNWIADEMLFEAGLHPLEIPSRLSKKELERLFAAGQRIVERAIERDTHYGDFPAEMFVNYRQKEALHPDFPESPVERLIVGGRGTFIVPKKQQLKKR